MFWYPKLDTIIILKMLPVLHTSIYVEETKINIQVFNKVHVQSMFLQQSCNEIHEKCMLVL